MDNLKLRVACGVASGAPFNATWWPPGVRSQSCSRSDPLQPRRFIALENALVTLLRGCDQSTQGARGSVDRMSCSSRSTLIVLLSWFAELIPDGNAWIARGDAGGRP